MRESLIGVGTYLTKAMQCITDFAIELFSGIPLNI